MSNLLSILFSPLTSARDFIYGLLLMHRNWFYICNHSPSILAVKYRNKICVGGYMGSSAGGDGVVTTTYGKIWAEMFVSTVIKNWIVYWHYSYPSGKWFLPVNWTSTRLRVIRSKVYSGVNNLQVKDASGTVCCGEHAWESIKLLRHQPPTHKRVCDLCNKLTNIAHLPFRYKPRDSCKCTGN